MAIILLPNRKFAARGWFNRFASAPGWFYSYLTDIAAAGLSATVGQVNETDTANAIVWAPKARLVGQVSTTETAQAITSRKSQSIGQNSESNVSQTITSRKTQSIGQVSESNTANAIAVAPKHRLVVRVDETDTARDITRTGVILVPVAQVSELDTAQSVAWAPKRRLVEQVFETDLAQTVSVGGEQPGEGDSYWYWRMRVQDGR